VVHVKENVATFTVVIFYCPSHSASYSVGTRGSYPRDKATGH